MKRPWRSGKTVSTVSTSSAAIMASSSLSSIGRFPPGRLFGRDVGGADAAVDDELLAGHERRLVGGQEQGGVGDLRGLAEAADGHVHQPAGPLGVVGEQLG